MAAPYNPLDKSNLGKSIVLALLSQPVIHLGDLSPFEGAGVYVIYYAGDFPAYAPMASKNRIEISIPIYIGKAVPYGARKGVQDLAPTGQSLFKRRFFAPFCVRLTYIRQFP